MSACVRTYVCVVSECVCYAFPCAATSGGSGTLRVETTFTEQSSQPSPCSQGEESSHSYPSPATSTCVSNGQSSSSSPRQSLAGQHSAQSSQPDVPPSQLVFPTSIASSFQQPTDLPAYSSHQQPSLPSPVGLSESPVQNVSAPLSVMTTLSETYSSAPPSVVRIVCQITPIVHTQTGGVGV